MRLHAAMLLAVAAASPPWIAGARATVTVIVGPDGSSIGSTSEVELISFGSVQASALALNAELGIGDELRGVVGNTVVSLACSDTASVTLQGKFRVVIMPSVEGKTCFLDLFAGAAHVVGDTSTGLGLGDVTAGAERTHYGVTVSRSPEGVRRDLQVFDGEVVVRPADSAPPGGDRGRPRPGDRPVPVTAGYVLSVARGSYEPVRMTAQQIASAAKLYAVVDASRVSREVRPAVVRDLSGAYARVLAHPDDVDSRLKLVEQQVKYDATSKTTLYQIERARVSAPHSMELDATTRALSVAAYTQLGEEAKAAARYESLRSYDRQTVQNSLRVHRIDPEVIQRAGRFDARGRRGTAGTLQVRAVSDPPVIPVGGRSRIRVEVTTGAGLPVEGARVRVAAGGGAFVHGATEAEGVTDAGGSFGTVWGCSSCAPAYVLSVEVAKDGFPPARTDVAVQVR